MDPPRPPPPGHETWAPLAPVPLLVTSGSTATEARTVGKRAVRIILKCFLVGIILFVSERSRL